MPCYYFHLRRDGVTVTDEEGEEFATREEAWSSAVTSVRELVAERIKSGGTIGDEHIDVTDSRGDLQFSLSFLSVVEGQLKK